MSKKMVAFIASMMMVTMSLVGCGTNQAQDKTMSENELVTVSETNNDEQETVVVETDESDIQSDDAIQIGDEETVVAEESQDSAEVKTDSDTTKKKDSEGSGSDLTAKKAANSTTTASAKEMKKDAGTHETSSDVATAQPAAPQPATPQPAAPAPAEPTPAPAEPTPTVARCRMCGSTEHIEHPYGQANATCAHCGGSGHATEEHNFKEQELILNGSIFEDLDIWRCYYGFYHGIGESCDCPAIFAN